MAKVNKKEVKKEEAGIPSGMQARDLSVEKRGEIFSQNFEKFKTQNLELLGMTLDVEQAYTPKGAFPRMVMIDMLAKEKNEKAKQEQSGK